jgi:hypothetical protein
VIFSLPNVIDILSPKEDDAAITQVGKTAGHPLHRRPGQAPGGIPLISIVAVLQEFTGVAPRQRAGHAVGGNGDEAVRRIITLGGDHGAGEDGSEQREA